MNIAFLKGRANDAFFSERSTKTFKSIIRKLQRFSLDKSQHLIVDTHHLSDKCHWFALSRHNKKVLSLNQLAKRDLSVLPMPAWISFRCSHFLLVLKNMQVKPAAYSTLLIGVNMCVNCYSSVC